MLSKAQQATFLKTYFGFKTIKAYQKSQGLKQDGKWGVNTNKRALSNMRAVQNRLNVNGARIKVDGIAGPDTIKAIKSFQRNNNLKITGSINKNTYSKLFVQIKEGYVSEHFTKAEFKCGCGGKWCNGYNGRKVNKELLDILEAIRYKFGKPVLITSGIRCQKYNDSLKGSIKNSVHRTGGAADIYIAGVTDTAAGRRKVRDYAYECGAAYSYYGTANMGNAVHINVQEDLTYGS